MVEGNRAGLPAAVFQREDDAAVLHAVAVGAEIVGKLRLDDDQRVQRTADRRPVRNQKLAVPLRDQDQVVCGMAVHEKPLMIEEAPVQFDDLQPVGVAARMELQNHTSP